jgi:hypothetical protein
VRDVVQRSLLRIVVSPYQVEQPALGEFVGHFGKVPYQPYAILRKSLVHNNPRNITSSMAKTIAQAMPVMLTFYGCPQAASRARQSALIKRAVTRHYVL